MNKTFYEQIRSALFGLAIADAVGVPAEFCPRRELTDAPITDMTGFRTHFQPAGTWSDDSSMAFCLADSMIETGTIHPRDIMERFARWCFNGDYTPWGKCFDSGHTCVQAISRFQHGTDPLLCGGDHGYSNGNGSLMRILPLLFPLVRFANGPLWKCATAMEWIHRISGITHRHPIARSACGIYLCVAQQLLTGEQDAVQKGIDGALSWYEAHDAFRSALPVWKRLRSAAALQALPVEDIRSGGYVVDTLEAAVWCLLTTDSYRDCVLKAVNLGEDTDTTAAVAGGLAGLLYGMEDIPANWRDGIAQPELIERLCRGLNETEIVIPV